jgi:hypothetical protein
MGYTYQTDGSVVCQGEADPTRTATYAGPKNSNAQINSVVAFFALEPVVTLQPGTLEWLLSLRPATSAPPGVSDASNKGTLGQLFALGDHTHASKARKEIKAISATGLYTWTFPTAFGAGVVPVCNSIAICPSGTTDLINVQQEGDATNTQVVFRVTRYQQSAVALIGLTILSVNGALPANIKLSMLALEP